MKLPTEKRNGRRKGIVAVYVAMSLIVMLGAAALAIDVGYVYMRQTQMQRAADSAALAGAYPLSFINGTSPAGIALAKSNAATYAAYNDYTNGVRGAVVTADYPAFAGAPPDQFRVTIARPEPLFFAGVFRIPKANISVSSTAVFTPAIVDIPVAQADFGANLVGPGQPNFNYTIYGPDAPRGNGDNISSQFFANGSPNPQYVAPNYNTSGFNFILNTGTMRNPRMRVELFDPDTGNSDARAASGPYGADFAGPWAVDELRDPIASRNLPGYVKNTRTVFTLYQDNGTPAKFSDDTVIATYDANGARAGTDNQWTTPTGFEFDRLAPINSAPVNYRLNVTTTSGSSENGFAIRSGPPTAGAFDPNNGSNLATRDIMSINFNKDVNAAIPLGTIPRAAAGGVLTVTKFDTDVLFTGQPNNTVYYTCDNPDVMPTAAQRSTVPGAPPNAFAGNVDLTSDTFSTDTISLPADYPGGAWTANYTAGVNDTSTWRISATGSNPGSISLKR